ncbi:MAG TPA: tyrosine-type recombinase/integrase [Pyrinomonadaceae bacterium]|nr:tyrosine-type recombinase/integrase [Pyrinomonadaceae bacterium]
MAYIYENPLILFATVNSGKTILTYFNDGIIVELPTRWLHSLSCKPKYSDLTVNQYGRSVTDFLKWLLEEGQYSNHSLDTLLKIVNRRAIEHWIKDRKAARIEASTLRNREVSVKMLFDWLTSEEGGRVRTLENTPYKTGKLISPPPEGRKPRFVTSDDVIRLLNGFHNESERCLAHTLYDTGMRISEAERLLKRELPDPRNFPDGLKYFPLYVRGSKGRGGQIKERIAIISAPVLARIRRYHNSPEYRFSPYFGNSNPEKPAFLSVHGYRLSRRNVGKQMECAAARVSLDPKFFSPHKLRHGAAFSILASELGKDYFDRLFLVQQVFGHKQITTTEIYTAIPPAILAKLNRDNVIKDKYQEAKRIKDATYLPPERHIERRGHRQ